LAVSGCFFEVFVVAVPLGAGTAFFFRGTACWAFPGAAFSFFRLFTRPWKRFPWALAAAGVRIKAAARRAKL
jgi:hypothetical protein